MGQGFNRTDVGLVADDGTIELQLRRRTKFCTVAIQIDLLRARLLDCLNYLLVLQ